MARKVQVLLIDDLDGSQAEETVSFALDGTSYEIIEGLMPGTTVYYTKAQTLFGFFSNMMGMGGGNFSGGGNFGGGSGFSGGDFSDSGFSHGNFSAEDFSGGKMPGMVRPDKGR